jgi:hypothetical protein
MQNLLDIQHTLPPGYNIDWDEVLGELAASTVGNEPPAFFETFCFLTRCSLVTRVNAIGVKQFQDHLAEDDLMISKSYFKNFWYNLTLQKL